MDYKLIEEMTPQDLQDEVNKMYKDGYVAIGGVITSMQGSYVQAIVKGNVRGKYKMSGNPRKDRTTKYRLEEIEIGERKTFQCESADQRRSIRGCAAHLKNRGMKFRTWIPSDSEIIVARVA